MRHTDETRSGETPEITESAGETIALTGATGFIGTRLQTRLLAAGYAVRALIRPGSSHRNRVMPGVEDVELNLAQAEVTTSAIKAVSGSTAIIYCAGSVRGRTLDDFEAANVQGIGNIARAAAGLHPAPRLLLMSSLAASEPSLSNYAASKRAGEHAVIDYPGVPWTIFRPPAVYGPGETELLPLFKLVRRGVTPVIGSPSQRISLIHVDDLISAVIEWLATPGPCEHQIYSMDDGHAGGYGWDDIADAAARPDNVTFNVPRGALDAVAKLNLALAKLFGYQPMLTPGKVRELCHEQWLANNAPFQQATGWKPEIGLAEGLVQTFATRNKG